MTTVLEEARAEDDRVRSEIVLLGKRHERGELEEDGEFESEYYRILDESRRKQWEIITRHNKIGV